MNRIQCLIVCGVAFATLLIGPPSAGAQELSGASLKAASTEPEIPWTPFIASWSCTPAEASSIACKLQAYGLPPDGFTQTNPTAKAWMFVRRGLTRGKGKVLSLIVAMMPCTSSSGYLICSETTPSLVLGPGVQLVNADAGVPPVANVYGQGTVPGPVFDWDGDGVITDREGMLLMRYLLGLRGAKLVSGIPLAPGISAASIEGQIQMLIWGGLFHLTGRAVATAPNDGLMVLRCIQGQRGAALTRGLTSRNTAEVDAMCEALMAIN